LSRGIGQPRADAAPFIVGQICGISLAFHSSERRSPSHPPSTFQTVSPRTRVNRPPIRESNTDGRRPHALARILLAVAYPWYAASLSANLGGPRPPAPRTRGAGRRRPGRRARCGSRRRRTPPSVHRPGRGPVRVAGALHGPAQDPSEEGPAAGAHLLLQQARLQPGEPPVGHAVRSHLHAPGRRLAHPIGAEERHLRPVGGDL
jgi:hypothetical protein